VDHISNCREPWQKRNGGSDYLLLSADLKPVHRVGSFHGLGWQGGVMRYVCSREHPQSRVSPQRLGYLKSKRLIQMLFGAIVREGRENKKDHRGWKWDDAGGTHVADKYTALSACSVCSTPGPAMQNSEWSSFHIEHIKWKSRMRPVVREFTCQSTHGNDHLTKP
jgi:hypothetical protein